MHVQIVATENFDDVGCVFCDIVVPLRASDLAAPRGRSSMVRSSPKFVSANVIHVTGKTRRDFGAAGNSHNEIVSWLEYLVSSSDGA